MWAAFSMCIGHGLNAEQTQYVFRTGDSERLSGRREFHRMGMDSARQTHFNDIK
jgi:hypothetical protein